MIEIIIFREAKLNLVQFQKFFPFLLSIFLFLLSNRLAKKMMITGHKIFQIYLENHLGRTERLFHKFLMKDNLEKIY